MRFWLLLAVLLLPCAAQAQMGLPGSIGAAFVPGALAFTFTVLNSGSVNATVTGSGTYSGFTLTGLAANPPFTGGCSGTSSVSNFSAANGVWSATFQTPAAPCTGGITVTAVSPAPAFAFTALNGGGVGSTVTGSGTYSGFTLTGIAASPPYGGTCSGTSTVTGFSAAAGTWSATFTTPSAACTGGITATSVP